MSGTEALKELILGKIGELRTARTEAEGLAAELKAAKAALEEKLGVPAWAELENGAEIAAGTQVRYLGRFYTCTAAHTKSLVRLPTGGGCWEETR